ncbi:MAG: hypothetical protein KF767_15390 [Bdellovibrionaceae bacterium]|nr:hypothetical protein [Pseudobdellovibrionaceae bacterium]
MKRMATSVITVCLALTALAFQNCSKANFTSDAVDVTSSGGNDDKKPPGPPDLDGDLPISETEAEQNCSNRSLSTANATVNFPKPPSCKWNKDGNLAERNGYVQARSEQRYDLPVPPNAVVCDVTFNFPKQDMLYDDEIIMTFNGYVLASSYKNLTDMLPKDGDLRRYEWEALKGKATNVSGYDPYIVGQEIGLASVQMPATQTSGQIKLDMDKQIFYKFAAKKLPADAHRFGFITTGDNDSSDCQHEPIQFSFNVKYYVP